LAGRSELGLKWYREAQASFANALRLSPANRDIRSYRDFVNGLMGQGDNSAVVDPIEPVAFPAALTNTPDEPATAGYAKKYGAYYARRITATRYLPGKEHKTTDLILVNILDSSGVSAFSTVQFGFDPLAEQVYVNEVRVMDAGGKTLSAGSPTNYYVLDDRTSTSASQKKVLNVPVPGLQPGCRLAVTFTRRDQGRIEDFPFQSYCFSRYSPVRESIFFLAGDAHGLKYRSSVEPEKLPEGLVWRVSDPALAVWEPLQPTAATFLPMLWISDASAQWPALVTNYLASIRDRLEPDAALQEQSRKLVAGMTDDDAKIAALASYVQTNLTYKALEFGRRARIPNKPAEVIQNKYGDCKDHSVLLQQMLAAAGVPAQLALAGHRGPIQQDLPSLDQFDHMIVFVPGAAGGRFLDCTGKGTDVAHALPLELEGQDVLVLDAANPRFVTIPAYPTNASSISAEQHVRVVDLTDMAVEESLIFSGVYAAYLRGYLLQIPEASRRTTLQSELAMTDADLTDVKMEALDNPREPLRLAFTYSIKRQFRRSNGELRGVLHAGYCRNYLQAAPVETRLTPFEITVPYTLESKIAVAIPAGYQAVRPDNLNPVFDARFATCEGRARIDGNQLLVDFKYRPTVGKFKAGDYSAYRETMAQAMSLLEREVVFKANTP
jgi:transglutaminase-like putative cysteine protease